MLVTVPPDAIAAQVLSPRRYVVALAVPVADKSPVIVPVAVIGPPVTSTKVPLLVATLVTVPSYSSVELMVTVVPDTLVVTFVPPARVIVPDVVIAVPAPLSAAAVMLVTVPPDGIAAHVLSPRRYVVALAVPVADKSAVTEPVVVMPATGSVATEMNAPSKESTSVTVPEPPPPPASTQDIENDPFVEST